MALITRQYLEDMFSATRVLQFAQETGSEGTTTLDTRIGSHIAMAEDFIVGSLWKQYTTEQIAASTLLQRVCAVITIYTLEGRKLGGHTKETEAEYQAAMQTLAAIQSGDLGLSAVVQFLPPSIPSHNEHVMEASGFFVGLPGLEFGEN